MRTLRAGRGWRRATSPAEGPEAAADRAPQARDAAAEMAVMSPEPEMSAATGPAASRPCGSEPA